MKKIILLIIILWQINNCFSQIIYKDTIVEVRKEKIKLCIVENKGKDTAKIVYYNNDKILFTETILIIAPHSTAITGFKDDENVNKIISDSENAIIEELKKQKIPFDSTKIKENSFEKLNKIIN